MPDVAGGSGLGIVVGLGLVVLIGGVIVYFAKREEDRLDRMSAEERHQYQMDKLTTNVAGAATHAPLDRRD